jgi:hypothetical protein
MLKRPRIKFTNPERLLLYNSINVKSLYFPGYYILKNLANNRIYIGSSSNISCRIKRHIKNLENNKHKNKELQHDWNFGHNFIICETRLTDTASEAAQLEAKLISENPGAYNKIRNRDWLPYVESLTKEEYLRIISKTSPMGECIEWNGMLDAYGYGVYDISGKFGIKVHRLSWIIENKKNIPFGLTLCHKCDNRKCLNISHLFLGTAQDNAKDREEKGRGGNKMKHLNKIVELANSGLSHKEIADRLDITSQWVKRNLERFSKDN